MVQTQHKWVYKKALKLTPSTVKWEIAQKKKTNHKDLSSMKCFHRSAASGPKMKLNSLCAVASTLASDPPYCGHPGSFKYQSCQPNVTLF